MSDERDQLVTLCQGLGASPAQAAVMADQLQKRCEQLMAERGLSRVEAMRYLLELVTKGARGEAPPGFEGTKPETR